MRRRADAVARNRAPIAECLQRWLPQEGADAPVLEIASGTGEHAVHFAQTWPHLTFQPSDPDPDARASIDAWVAHAGLPNLRPALALDATEQAWPLERAVAIVCINMVHISPWAATLGLMHGAGRLLAPGGILYLYGPYQQEGLHTAPSNEAFHQSLKARNPAWGVRDMETVVAAALAERLTLAATEPMPANNYSLIFRR